MNPKIAVLDYGIGNLGSAQKAFVAIGADAKLVRTPTEVSAADAVVLPGVGAFGACVDALHASGLDRVALEAIHSGAPFLGICVGMQMLFRSSAEDPTHAGLGVFDRGVVGLEGGVKIPQMQWNKMTTTDHPMFAGLNSPWVYFVHSFAAEPGSDVIATCDYGGPVTAAVARDSIWATQFHPEKSAQTGLRILRNFVDFAGRSR